MRRIRRGDALAIVLGTTAAATAISGLFLTAVSYSSYMEAIELRNKLSEPPILRDVNEDGIRDITLRYLNGEVRLYLGDKNEESGEIEYRLSITN